MNWWLADASEQPNSRLLNVEESVVIAFPETALRLKHLNAGPLWLRRGPHSELWGDLRGNRIATEKTSVSLLLLAAVASFKQTRRDCP
jgi:hypothetical protein